MTHENQHIESLLDLEPSIVAVLNPSHEARLTTAAVMGELRPPLPPVETLQTIGGLALYTPPGPMKVADQPTTPEAYLTLLCEDGLAQRLRPNPGPSVVGKKVPLAISLFTADERKRLESSAQSLAKAVDPSHIGAWPEAPEHEIPRLLRARLLINLAGAAAVPRLRAGEDFVANRHKILKQLYGVHQLPSHWSARAPIPGPMHVTPLELVESQPWQLPCPDFLSLQGLMSRRGEGLILAATIRQYEQEVASRSVVLQSRLPIAGLMRFFAELHNILTDSEVSALTIADLSPTPKHGAEIRSRTFAQTHSRQRHLSQRKAFEATPTSVSVCKAVHDRSGQITLAEGKNLDADEIAAQFEVTLQGIRSVLYDTFMSTRGVDAPKERYYPGSPRLRAQKYLDALLLGCDRLLSLDICLEPMTPELLTLYNRPRYERLSSGLVVHGVVGRRPQSRHADKYIGKTFGIGVEAPRRDGRTNIPLVVLRSKAGFEKHNGILRPKTSSTLDRPEVIE